MYIPFINFWTAFAIGLVLIISNTLDGIRDGDANIGRKCKWWPWHIVKWGSTWLVWILLWLTMWNFWYLMVIVPICCKIGFRIGRLYVKLPR
jgi:hypothetical protein